MRRLALLLAILLVLSPGSSPAVGTRASGSPAALTARSLTYPASYWTVGCIHLGYPGGGTNPYNYFQLRRLIDSLNVAYAANRNNVEALVVNGDWAEDGIQSNPVRGDSLAAIYNAAKFRMLFNLGNHEALPSDTLSQGNPYASAIARFPEMFNGKMYYSVDTEHFRLILLNNNANQDVNDLSDYRVNNPFNTPEPDGLHEDYAGISFSISPQRKFLTSVLKNLGLRAPVLFGHRAIYGSNANAESRHNFISAGTGSGYVRYFEQQLAAGRRAEANEADQHLKIVTEAMVNGALASPSQGGVYHNQDISGFGIRNIDTTTVISAGSQGYKSYIGLNPATGTSTRARTSTGIPEQWNTTNDPDLTRAWFATEHQYWGDYVLVKTYRVWTSNSVGAPGYNGAGSLKLVDVRYSPLDVRGRYTQTTAPGDQSAPSQVTDLAGAATGHTTATVTWTAPGDDGNQGTAASYDLRYSTSVITSGNFASSSAATGEPTPGVSGSPQSMSLAGLTQGTTYYIALKSADEASNTSAISNVTQFTTTAPDVVPPADITNLAGTLVWDGGAWSLILGWAAPGDDGATGTAASYDLRRAASNITAGTFAAATSITAPTPAAAGTRQNVTITGLTTGTTYYFAMKASDEVPNTSGLSNIYSVLWPSPVDVTAPATTTTLAVAARAATSLTLGWTAPGDDGTVGIPSTYDVKYSPAPAPIAGRLNVVGNGSFTPANSSDLSGNFAQAVGAGSGSYAPASVAALLLNQTQPMIHAISGGSPSVSVPYAACLSAIVGGAYQWHASNNTFTLPGIPTDPATPIGGFGVPSGPGTIVGKLASRAFANATVYCNLSKTDTTSYPGGTLAALAYAINWTLVGQADGPGRFPQRGGIYWGNLTPFAVSQVATWSTVVLNDSNVNGPRADSVSADPIGDLRRLRPDIKVGMSVNGFDVFVSSTTPRTPSIYWPMQVRMFYKAEALGAWVKASDGVSPLEHNFGSWVRYVDFTNTPFRIWLAGQIDSLAIANRLDFLFIDQLESSLASEKAASPSTNWPTDQAWTAANADLLARVQAGLPASISVVGEPAPQIAGSSETMTISGLANRSRYWFQMRTADEAANWSGWSNVATDTTTAPGTAYPVKRAFVTYDGGIDMDTVLRNKLKDRAPKYVDSPRANDATWIAANMPGTTILTYNSLTDDYVNQGEWNWKTANAVSNGCADIYEPYMTFWNDTIVQLQGQTMLVKGWGGPGGTAASKAEAVIPVYYSDRSRAFCNFSTAAARQTHRKYLSTQQLQTGPFGGIWGDNSFSRLINLQLVNPYFSYPNVTSGGGSWTPGFYYFCVTAVTPLGETTKSTSYGLNLSATSTVNMSWGSVPGATAYKVYMNTSDNWQSGNLLLASVSGTTYAATGDSRTTGTIRAGQVAEDPAHSYIASTAFYNWFWYQGLGLALKEWRQFFAGAPAELNGKTCKLAINVANIPYEDDARWVQDYVTLGNPGNPADHPADIIFQEFEHSPGRYYGQDFPNHVYQAHKAAADAGIDIWDTGYSDGIGAPTAIPADTTGGVSSGAGSYTISEWMQGVLAFHWVTRTDRTYLTGWAAQYPGSCWVPTDAHWQLYNFKAGWDVDLGQPVAGSSGVPYIIASGTDPKGKAYKVWAREFSGGWALVRMRGSYDQDIDPGTAVTVALPQPLRPVLMNGTVAATPVSSITVRNAQGWILKK